MGTTSASHSCCMVTFFTSRPCTSHRVAGPGDLKKLGHLRLPLRDEVEQQDDERSARRVVRARRRTRSGATRLDHGRARSPSCPCPCRPRRPPEMCASRWLGSVVGTRSRCRGTSDSSRGDCRSTAGARRLDTAARRGASRDHRLPLVLGRALLPRGTSRRPRLRPSGLGGSVVVPVALDRHARARHTARARRIVSAPPPAGCRHASGPRRWRTRGRPGGSRTRARCVWAVISRSASTHAGRSQARQRCIGS